MIITRLVNNLKCLIGFYQQLVFLTDRVESTVSDPFQVASYTIEASDSTNETISMTIPAGATIMSIILVRVGGSIDDVESISVDGFSQTENQSEITLTIDVSGGHTLNDYEIQVIYFFQ